MKNKIILPILFLLAFGNGQAQKNKKTSEVEKCKLVHDVETNLDLYKNLEVYPELMDATVDLDEFVISNFKLPVKEYDKKLKIKFIWLVEKTGKCTFLKLSFPKDDKEMEEETKRVVNLIPLFSPARCGNDSVPCKVDFEVGVARLKK